MATTTKLQSPRRLELSEHRMAFVRLLGLAGLDRRPGVNWKRCLPGICAGIERRLLELEVANLEAEQRVMAAEEARNQAMAMLRHATAKSTTPAAPEGKTT